MFDCRPDFSGNRLGTGPSADSGLGVTRVMTSDELLQGTDQLYRSIVIIGGGVIGVEFACFYSQLGCEVTVVEGLDRLLPNLDRELAKIWHPDFEKARQ